MIDYTDKNLSLEEKKTLRTPLWDSNINWDDLTTEIFVKNHKPSWNYCDVGSCQGLFSNLFVELAKPNGKVFAFEIYDGNPIIPNTIFEKILLILSIFAFSICFKFSFESNSLNNLDSI